MLFAICTPSVYCAVGTTFLYFNVFHFPCSNQISNTQTSNKNTLIFHYTLYSQYSHQYVSAAMAVIYRVMLLLQEYKGTNVASCVAVTK